MNQESIAVFGGSGFLGSRIVQKLLDRNFHVRIAARNPERADPLLSDQGRSLEFVRCDIGDDASVARAVAGAHSIVNAVSLYVERGGSTFHSVHVDAAARLARHAHAAGVTRLIQISGIGADAQSCSPYIRARGLGEAAVRAEFPAAMIVRPSVTFGPDDAFLSPLARLLKILPLFPMFGSGGTKLQPVHVDDVAEAVARIIERGAAGARVHELAGPDTLSYKAILQAILQRMNRKRLLLPVPFLAWRVAGYFAEFLPSPPVTRNQIELMQLDNVASGKHAGFAELGMAPRSLERELATILKDV
jgi:NADH dehydrogenase